MRNPKIYGTGRSVILSVEDDNAAYSLIEIGFEEAGGNYRLYRVEDGAEALAFLRRLGPYEDVPKPNLVLLNLNLPRVTGYEVLQAMNDDPTIENAPCVVFSSSRMDRDKARCMALGARAFVNKPNDLDEFLHVIRDVCSLA